MDSTLKQRLIGAAVLAALAIIFLPMLLKGPDVREPDAAQVPLSMPATPSQDFETRELPLTVPDAATPPGGALGMAPGSTPPPAPELPIPDATATPVGPVPPVALEQTIVEAPVPPAEAARVGAGRHVVNVGIFANLANANSLAARLRGAGLPVIAERVSLAGGSAMRLRVGPYATRASAEAARLRAEQATGTSSTVIVLDAAVASSTQVTSSTPAPMPAPAAAPVKAAAPAAPTSAASTGTAPTSAAPAPAASGFAVQLSAPSAEADANTLRDKARAAGFSSFVQRIETASGTRFRVRVGPVADRSAATTLRDAVNSKLGTGGIVVTNP